MKICLDKSVQYQLANIHKYKSSQRNQQLLQGSLFITNIPESKISAEHIWTIYRARWQIDKHLILNFPLRGSSLLKI